MHLFLALFVAIASSTVILYPFKPESTQDNVILNYTALRLAADLYNDGVNTSFRIVLPLETLEFPTARAHRTKNHFTWFGSALSDLNEMIYATLSVTAGPRAPWQQGRISVDGGIDFAGRTWRIRTRNNGVVVCEHKIENLDPSPDDNTTSTLSDDDDYEDTASIAGLTPEDLISTGRKLMGKSLGGSGQTSQNGYKKIRIMVLFDRAQCGGSERNHASNVNNHMNNAWCRQMKMCNFEVIYTCQVFINGGGLWPGHRALAAPTVVALRRQYGADMIVGAWEYPDNVGGMGTIGPSGNAVVSVKRSLLSWSDHVVPHELGHNFGMNHDRYNVQRSGTVYYCNKNPSSCNYAYQDNKYYTLMAYGISKGCSDGPTARTRVYTYSGYNGKYSRPCGTPEGANNWAVFLRNWNTIAGRYSGSTRCVNVRCAGRDARGCVCA